MYLARRCRSDLLGGGVLAGMTSGGAWRRSRDLSRGRRGEGESYLLVGGRAQQCDAMEGCLPAVPGLLDSHVGEGELACLINTTRVNRWREGEQG